MSASAPEFHWDDDLITGEPGASSILPPPPEERVDLEQVLREHTGAVPTLAITIRPDDAPRASVAPSIRPTASKQRGLQIVIALAAGIAAAAIVGTLDRDDPAGATRARIAPTEVTDVGALAPEAPVVEEASAVAASAAVSSAPASAPVAIEPTLERAPRRPTREVARPFVPVPVEAPAPPVEAPAAPVEVPAAPAAAELSRDDVRRVMESLRPSLLQCADGANGRVQLQLVVHPTGRVQSSLVEGAFVGRSQGSCMARAGRVARFPAFASATPTTIRYPYSL